MTESQNLGSSMRILSMMEQVQDSNERITRENRRLSEEKEGYRKALEEAQAELKTAKSDISTMRKEKEDILTECRGILDSQKSESRKKISELSSQNLVLQNELRRKSGIIVSLNEQIGRLSESDVILKQNEVLKQQNAKLEQDMREVLAKAEKREEDAELRVKTVMRDVEARIGGIQAEEKQLKVMREDIGRYIEAQALGMFANEQKQLEERFRRKGMVLSAKYMAKVGLIYGFSIATLLYGITVTLLTATHSKRVMEDACSCVFFIGFLIKNIVRGASSLAGFLSGISLRIPYHLFSQMVKGLLVALSYVFVVGGMSGLVGSAIYRLGKFYHKNFWDRMSLIVTLSELMVIVWGADIVGRWLPWNSILMFWAMHGVYVFVRMLVTRDGR